MTLSDDEADAVDEERVLKIVVCGDGSAGKTSLCQRFAKDAFDRNYHQTVGLDFFSRRLTLPGDVQVLLQVWDIGGQSIGGEMVHKYVTGCHCALLVYDVTNMRSFDDVQDWLALVRRITKEQEKPPHLVLVGNKVDLESKRAVTIEMHQKLAKQHDLGFAYCSAKTGDSVVMAFRQAAADVLKIPLTKAEQDADIVVVQGEIGPDVIGPRRGRINQSKQTAVCSIQ